MKMYRSGTIFYVSGAVLCLETPDVYRYLKNQKDLHTLFKLGQTL
jgi:hypothetical protein